MHQLGMLKRHSAPVITATQNVSVVENTTAVQTLTATHADGLPVTWSIVGGADSAKFSINSSSGALTFNTAPDFENPTDSGGNNVYDVTVRASDGNLFADQTKAITVTDATETVTRFVALGSGGARGSYSDDYGASWHDCSGLAATTYTGVCWGNGQFVAVAFSGTNRVATSPDGKTWTQRSAAAANGWEGVAYSPALGLYVAVSSDGTNRVMTSPDGITWTSRSASQANPWQSVAWSPSLGLFAAVAQTGTNRVMTSPDGINWTNRTHSVAATFYDICWSEEKSLFVAVARGGTSAMTSPDGINWTTRTVPSSNWTRVCYDNALDLFVACSDSNSTSCVMTSPDGTTWTARTAEAGNFYTGIDSDDAGHVVIAGSAKAQKSTNGTSWDASVTTTASLGASRLACGTGVTP